MSTDSLESGRYLSQVDASCTLKVLVVDDERDLADLAGELLSAYAVANRVAYSAEEGLRAIGQDSEINAVFSDIMMPRMNGLQMAMTIKDRYPEVKIILTSGFTPPEILVMHDAFYMFTPKPYKIETVIKIFTSDFKFRRSYS